MGGIEGLVGLTGGGIEGLEVLTGGGGGPSVCLKFGFALDCSRSSMHCLLALDGLRQAANSGVGLT